VTKAQSSVQRATVIVEKLVPAPGQEEQIAALRLELSTTAAELTEALSRIPLLQKQTDDLLAKWVEENARAASLYEQWHGEQERADKAVASMKRVSAERDVFIKLFAVAFTVAAMMALTPIIKVFGSGFGPLYGPWVHLGCFIGGSAIAYIGAVSLIRLLLRIFVVL
jgi:hypothetical protein